jgi:hypothetical protein
LESIKNIKVVSADETKSSIGVWKYNSVMIDRI